MKLGGFVIHGNSQRTLGACLDSLLAVSDHVVAVDSGSTDGSAELVRQRGVTPVRTQWRGYGASRALAVASLPPDCDYVLYLDADERLGDESIEVLRRLKQRRAGLAPVMTLKVRDWAELDGHRFVYRSHNRGRLVRRDLASWRPEMIVHEALPRHPSTRSGAVIEHEFAINPDFRLRKDRQYALLWALQAYAESRGSKPGGLQRLVHLMRDTVVKGAAFRGGAPAVKLAWQISRYHLMKQDFLNRVRSGEFAELLELYRRGALVELFAATAELTR